jgi:hypothetical protein
MSECLRVEKLFRHQLAALDWTAIDPGYTASMQKKVPEGSMETSVRSRKVDHDA